MRSLLLVALLAGFTPGASAQRMVSPAARLPGSHHAGSRARNSFNPLAFAAPAPNTFGNLGRNTVYGPGMQTLDAAVGRSFSITESARVQVRLEAFNSLNKVNLGTPNRFVNTAQFGTITEASTPGRQVQISARFSF